MILFFVPCIQKGNADIIQMELGRPSLYIDFDNMTSEEQQAVCEALARLYNEMSSEEKKIF